MSEPVYQIRRNLDQIGALVDFPPELSGRGSDGGVVSHVLHRPDEFESVLDDRGPAKSQAEPEDVDDPAEGDFDPVFEWGPEAVQKISVLGAAAGSEIQKSVKVDSGSDALGHYMSFHVRGLQWGASIKLSGIAWLVTQVFRDLPVDLPTKSRLAFHAILQHELFHFATDIAVAQAELSQRQAWWGPAKADRLARNARYLPVEEKFANAWMLRTFRTALPGFRVRGKQEALKRFVALQPDGYRHGLEVKSARDWSEGLHQIAWCYAEDASRTDDNDLLWGNGYDWSSHFPLRPRIEWRDCAIHLVDDSARFGIPTGWLTFFSALPTLQETGHFRKQLMTLSPKVQAAWEKVSVRARDGLTRGHDFKQWKPGGPDVWSLRVNEGYRAHLRHDRTTDTWIAIAIGGHKEMGHG